MRIGLILFLQWVHIPSSLSACDVQAGGLRTPGRPTMKDMGVASIIHERFYCKRGYAAAAGVLAAQSVNVLQRVRFPPSWLRLPVSQRVCALS